MLPSALIRNGLNDIPVFDNLALIDTKQIVECDMLILEPAFRLRDNKIPLPKNLVDFLDFTVISLASVDSKASPARCPCVSL